MENDATQEFRLNLKGLNKSPVITHVTMFALLMFNQLFPIFRFLSLFRKISIFHLFADLPPFKKQNYIEVRIQYIQPSVHSLPLGYCQLT